MKGSISCLKRYSFVPIMICIFLLLPITNLLGNSDYIPKNPRFARKLGFITGVATPIFLGIPGLSMASGSNGDTTSEVIGITLATIGLLTPPLGNLYAGEINKGIAALYGAANLSWMIGVISFYRQGIPDRDPTVTEGIFWILGFTLRIPAGIWDWVTASETTVRKNAQRRGITQKGFLTSYIDTNESSFGFKYNLSF